MCERFGSAARLKAVSHPIGGRDSVVTTGDEAFEACLGTSGRRSPLSPGQKRKLAGAFPCAAAIFERELPLATGSI